ncbi:L-type lectin-domain containing receptor kinase IX.1-like protein [Tanacetum coccineum]|uniref:L-type lectin-domain containing receptor kinase IX.1-like protein n=1 Tax=Tanacetum coccineum TaxID=301880 RepID=A0ABQ5D7P2_9ASTR
MKQMGAKSIDWIATVALGLLVGQQGNSSSSDNTKNEYGDLMLMAFWAPYLQLHLGGPDAIIAFALADNELWRACAFLWMRKKKTREVEAKETRFDIEMDNEFEMGIRPNRFTYHELARATGDFAKNEKLGEGSYGGVYKGFMKDSKTFIAVKRVSKSSKHGIKEYVSEVKIVSRLRHRNQVQLELLLAYEYMEIGRLDSHLFKAKSLLTWGTRYKIANGLESALMYLHEKCEQCVLHRYIKASNVTLDSNFNSKLGDFRLAKLVDHEKGLQTTMLAGNLGYMAPECVVTRKLTMALLENGFVQSKFDYSFFTKKSDKVFIALLVYMDDILITGNYFTKIVKFKLFLKSKFQIKDLGKLKYFLGIEVLDNKEGICLSQRKYCLELLHEYGLLVAKHVDTHLHKNTTLNHIETDDDHLLIILEIIRSLWYMHAPLVSHLDAVLVVLRYLKGSLRSGIQINKSGNLKLRAYADSDSARCHATRKSISEYRSMASATCEFRVKDLLSIIMYCDNSSALQIAANPVLHVKSKHFEIYVHLVREKVASGVIKTEKIQSSQKIADVLTEALDIEQPLQEKGGLGCCYLQQ